MAAFAGLVALGLLKGQAAPAIPPERLPAPFDWTRLATILDSAIAEGAAPVAPDGVDVEAGALVSILSAGDASSSSLQATSAAGIAAGTMRNLRRVKRRRLVMIHSSYFYELYWAGSRFRVNDQLEGDEFLHRAVSVPKGIYSGARYIT